MCKLSLIFKEKSVELVSITLKLLEILVQKLQCNKWSKMLESERDLCSFTLTTRWRKVLPI